MNRPLLALLCGLPTVLACEDETVLPDLPDWSDGYESDCCPGEQGTDTGTEPPIDLVDFALVAPDDLDYDVRIHQTGATGNACALTPGATVDEYVQMDCTLEVAELNLFGEGLIFDLTVPEGSCEHVVWMHYMYEAWEVGTGPDVVAITVDEDGEIVSETNAYGGEPYCDYNYSYWDVDAPNCCLGSYIVEVTDLATGQTEVDGGGDWGGEASDCYAGAAFEDPEVVLTADGWPTARIENLHGVEFYKRFDFDLLGDQYATNVNYANYYDPADHDGSVPAGYTGEWAVPTYRFVCYDTAEEPLARIDLVVREWNEESEYEAGGDPDTEGTESTTGLPLNDRQDWADATPGDSTWIQAAQ
ncbi:hypothetical protein L6R53_09005 [Myxococcota bacterium]|nr:hypothetical protein [Myxococcota bacterium]